MRDSTLINIGTTLVYAVIWLSWATDTISFAQAIIVSICGALLWAIALVLTDVDDDPDPQPSHLDRLDRSI